MDIGKAPEWKNESNCSRRMSRVQRLGIDDKNLKVPKQIIAKRQTIIDSFEIQNGFPKVLWEFATYTKE
jgi:hypothetical protein